MPAVSRKRGLSGKLPITLSVGQPIWDPVWAKKDHAGRSHEMVHILKGDVVLHLEGRKYKCRTGDTFIVPVGVMHRDEFALDSGFEALLVHFDWVDLDAASGSLGNDKLIALPLADKRKVKEMVLDLYEMFRSNRLLSREITDAGLYRILLFLISAVRENRSRPRKSDQAQARRQRKEVIATVKEFVMDNIAKPITLTDIATYLGMSTFHLSHVFSQESKFTLSSYIIQMRMERAATLLQDASKRVADVAYETGFEDPNYFGKAFRKYFNQSPGEYRTKTAGKKRK